MSWRAALAGLLSSLLMRLPTPVDRFVEHSLLGNLGPAQLSLLRGLLLLNTVLGLTLAWLYPATAALTLLFPCVVLVFFGAPPAHTVGWMAVFSLLVPHPLQIATFTLAVLIGSLFAHVTAERYRQSRAHELALEKAMDLARRRQRQLEPPALQTLLGRLEVACSLQVCRQLGGDFVCVHTLGPQRASVVLGDVMGKGLPAGLVSVYVEGVCRQLAADGLEPGPLLNGLNRSLAGFAPEEILFATALAVEVDFEKRCWKVARAGHELPLLNGQPLLGAPHLPLGLDPNQEWTQEVIPLQPGDCLVAVTDGVTDPLGALEALRLPVHCAQAVVVTLLGRLPSPLEDDATVAVLKVTE